MPAIVRRADKYVSDWNLQSDKFRFNWTTEVNEAAEYSDEFAALVAGKVGGKTIPVVGRSKIE